MLSFLLQRPLCRELSVQAAEYTMDTLISAECVSRRVNSVHKQLLLCEFTSLATEGNVSAFFGEGKGNYLNEYLCNAHSVCIVMGENINIFGAGISA